MFGRRFVAAVSSDNGHQELETDKKDDDLLLQPKGMNYEYENMSPMRKSFESEKDKSILPVSVNDKEIVEYNSSTWWAAIIPCFLYTFFSVSMVMSNKAIGYTLPSELKEQMPQISVILYQNMIAVLLVESAKKLRFIDYPDFNYTTACSWLPMNVLFVSMLCSGFFALCFLSVPIVQTLKNLANIVTVFGDWYFFGESVSFTCFLAVAIMTLGAIFTGFHDVQFHFYGYFWIGINCLCTAAYTLFMRYASKHIKIPRMGMIYYNNLLSVIFLVPILLLYQEYNALMNPEIMTWEFIGMNTVAGVFGACLNFSSLYCVASTSATTYAIVGTLNKIPVTLIGFMLFGTQVSNEGLLFIGITSFGGLLYGCTKLPPSVLVTRVKNAS